MRTLAPDSPRTERRRSLPPGPSPRPAAIGALYLPAGEPLPQDTVAILSGAGVDQILLGALRSLHRPRAWREMGPDGAFVLTRRGIFRARASLRSPRRLIEAHAPPPGVVALGKTLYVEPSALRAISNHRIALETDDGLVWVSASRVGVRRLRATLHETDSFFSPLFTLVREHSPGGPVPHLEVRVDASASAIVGAGALATVWQGGGLAVDPAHRTPIGPLCTTTDGVFVVDGRGWFRAPARRRTIQQTLRECAELPPHFVEVGRARYVNVGSVVRIRRGWIELAVRRADGSEARYWLSAPEGGCRRLAARIARLPDARDDLEGVG